MVNYYYVPAKYTVTETFKFNGYDFYRSPVHPSPDLDYYSLVGGIYQTEDREKFDELREAGIFDTVVYDPSVCVDFLRLQNYYNSLYHDDLLRFEHIHDIFGGRLVKENEMTSYRESLGCIYHKVTQTIHSTNENEYESIFINYGTDYDSSGITVTVGYGTHETVLYDSRSAKVNRGPYFTTALYYPLKNGVRNVGSADPFTVTVTTTHDIIHVIPYTKYESVIAALSESENVTLDWLSNDSIPFRGGFPNLNESSIPNYPWVIDNDIPYRLGFPEFNESEKFDIHDEWVIINGWSAKSWSGLTSFNGRYVWSDGEDIYYSHGTTQYVLNESTSTWTIKTWTGLTSFSANNIWSDGENIYYSNARNQYILNKSTSTWETKTWSGLTSFYGEYIWFSTGGGIYYSNSSTQYVLNKSTNTWVKKTWSDNSKPNGNGVWSDGENVYYSNGSTQWILNSSRSTWPSKSWTGLTSFYGQYVWTDGKDIYYSGGSIQKVLDKSASKWNEKAWGGVTSFYGYYIWSDGKNYYYSNGSDQYVLHDQNPFRIDFPELKDSRDAKHDWYIDDDIPFQGGFPPLKESQSLKDKWVLEDDIPYRLDFPDLKKTSIRETWFQETGWDPYRPWPRHKPIIEEVQTIESIPPIDWTKSMKQDYEFYTVDPNTWYDDKKLDNIISCNITHDSTTDKRGNASITLTEAIPECYIRTYLLATQNNILYKFCLGTYLYMTSSDSFDGMKHNITMTGYTPLVELEEQYPKLGYHVVGYTNRKYGSEAPMVTDEIRDIIAENTRCEVESRVLINKPLLNDFVAGNNDNWLTVVNNILDASSLQSYILTVDEWGTIIIEDAPTIDDVATAFTYNDDNSSILLPTLDTFDDIYGIPNVMEVLYVGDKNMPAIRVVVKNEDEESIVSIPRRGREIVRRYTINNIAAPLNTQSYEAVRAQVEAQAYKLLEASSTIQKTISYSHGYCDVKVGDIVMLNYTRAGMLNVRAKVTSQRISCKPGCQVDETAVYTKKLWNRGV